MFLKEKEDIRKAEAMVASMCSKAVEVDVPGTSHDMKGFFVLLSDKVELLEGGNKRVPSGHDGYAWCAFDTDGNVDLSELNFLVQTGEKGESWQESVHHVTGWRNSMPLSQLLKKANRLESSRWLLRQLVYAVGSAIQLSLLTEAREDLVTALKQGPCCILPVDPLSGLVPPIVYACVCPSVCVCAFALRGSLGMFWAALGARNNPKEQGELAKKEGSSSEFEVHTESSP